MRRNEHGAVACVGALMLLAAVSVSAQDYPAKPVRIITGGVGTLHDIVTRQNEHGAVACVGALMLLAAVSVSAQDYPAKPVRIITGGVGTLHDIVTRQLAQRLAEQWGQPVVVDNQPAPALI